MKIDLERFKGALPYASELFGIYQPLLGWKSSMTVARMTRDQDEVVRGLTKRAITRTHADVAVRIDQGGASFENFRTQEVVHTRFMPRVAVEIDSMVARRVAAELPADRKPSREQWREMLSRGRLDAELGRLVETVECVLKPRTHARQDVAPDLLAYLSHGDRRRAAEERPAAEVMKTLMDREVSVASTLAWLAERQPLVLDNLFYRTVGDPFAEMMTLDGDPLADVGSNGLDAVLSPIGIVHLFRQYFFEFDTFLGPPVGHVWLSPGATLEIVEEVVRRSLTERIVEQGEETVVREEQATTVHDELSTAIKEENRNDLKFGFGASVQYDNGTLEAGAHADLSLENSRTAAREAAHKQMREQTQKLSSEIRRSFKSTFRTVVESTSTNSRRYLLQNSTQQLVNYELRRKMRQVGIQVQDIGTQLCWQVFVDDPGKELGVAKLLHIAQPPDLATLRAPEPPAKLEVKTLDVQLQFPYMRDTSSEGDGELDVLYIEGDDQEHIGGIHNIGYNDKIIFAKTYQLTSPGPGYALSDNFTVRHQHPGTVDAEVKLVTGTTASVEIILHQVNFKDQQTIELQLSTTWVPDPTQQLALDAAYAASLSSYEAERSALERKAFLDAARERVKLASQIRERRFEDLREEERIMVYRRLIAQLLDGGTNLLANEHLTSELIRAIFDVDKMLYFVAPEWWRPRAHDQPNQLVVTSATTVITEQELVGWDGPLAANRKNNYLVTEESDPARMGSSLGWLLELDGDSFRNAFLNSPWVKAIIPIRPGKEEAAINWLGLAQVAGMDGLDAAYDAPAAELQKITDGLAAIGRAAHSPVSLHDALLFLGDQIKRQYKAASTAQPSPFDPNKNVVPTETVYEHGFDPLPGGFEVDTDPTHVFSQWIEVLATDQVAAVPYDAAEHL